MDEYELVNCIDRALSVFGENIKHRIYWQLTQGMAQYSQSRGILKDPEIFVKVLKDTFGMGMWAIERQIIREITSSFKLEALEEDDLVSMMNKAHKKILAMEIQNQND